MARKPVGALALHDDLATTLEVVGLASLHPHPRNYGTHPPAELAHLTHSLTEHGLYRNVVIAQDGTILAGHGVVEAARQLGYTSLAVKRLPYAPDDPRALRVVVGDNEIARLRLADDVALTALLQELCAEDPLALLGTGFDEAMLAVLAGTPVINEAIAPEEFPVYDETIPTEHCCPQCGYVWSGTSTSTTAP